MDKKISEFLEKIDTILPKERIFEDYFHRVAYGTDSSFYRLIPKVVVIVENANEIKDILKLCDSLELPLTFRAAGSSVSGQSISDSILVMISRDWRGFEINDKGKTITLKPATIADHANQILKKYGKKIGPDPASIRTGFISGIVANNASGMSAGVEHNSYNTIKDMKIIFQDGFTLDTSDKSSREFFQKNRADMCEKILKIKSDIKQDSELSTFIDKKFSIKNTCGYYLKAFLDFDDPVEIIMHLMVGSEGTLAFMEEFTFDTVDELPKRASALLFFKDLKEGAKAIKELKKLPRRILPAAELMDRATLRSVQDDKGFEYLKELDDEVSAILLECVADDENELKQNIDTIISVVKNFSLIGDVDFSKDEKVCKGYWDIRKGMFPKVCSLRKPGTTVFIEDVAFPMESLDEALGELQDMLCRYGYDEAVMFGHALDGNIHFIVIVDFSKDEEIKKYEKFMDEVTKLVTVKYKGSLKAEHGTGRNMAPFVELEWGEKAYSLMRRVKEIFDPKNLLNPGVIINEDKKIHIKNFKSLYKTDPLIDLCIECGFCEPNCPSNALTLTPRQRIVINREIKRLENEKNEDKTIELLKDSYKYDGLDTCAACSLCSLSCPVGIDVANLTKKLRGKEAGDFSKKVARTISDHYGVVLKGTRAILGANSAVSSLFKDDFMQKSMNFLRDIAKGKIPRWSAYIPQNSKFSPEKFLVDKSGDKVVYFPSCICRTFGNQRSFADEPELYEIVNILINRAGYEIVLPKNVENLCCGTPMSSKGYKDEAQKQLKELENALYEATNQGEYPVLCETSPCVKAMVSGFEKDIKVYEPIEFTLKFLANKLEFYKIQEPITIHSTCSTRKLSLEEDFLKLAKMCSDRVIVPQNVTCCAFAGDRGFTHPELNAKALRWLKSDIKDAKEGYSTSITCEIGLNEHGEIPYKNILYLVERVTRKRK